MMDDERFLGGEAPARDRARGGALHVFDMLREDIITLKLAPGTLLSRTALQKRFGLSSTPIRDALLRLAEEHLVTVFPQHATMVSRIDIGRAREAQFLRRSLELEIVRGLALSPGEAVIARLRSLMRQQAAFADLGEVDAFNRADQAFHRAMYEAAGVIDLWHLVRRRGGHIDRLRRLHLPVEGKMREVLGHHEAIVAAIAAGRPEEAQRNLRDHLSQSLDFAERLKAAHPQYFAE
jgi:DNA-binding GntR family transcriptional regulator